MEIVQLILPLSQAMNLAKKNFYKLLNILPGRYGKESIKYINKENS